jgi:hypothetical protein
MDKPTRYYSKKQEQYVAKILDMKVQPNSGATSFAKGDVADENLLLECKTLMKPQTERTIYKEWLVKLKEEQLGMRKLLSALVMDFGDNQNYVVLPLLDFKNLYECWKEINND